jgi:hypothetical protein
VGGVVSTCALSCLDIREFDALRLDCRPVEVASLPVGDVASLRVRTLHEHGLALAMGGGCAGYGERQRQSGQCDILEERSHVERCYRNTRQSPQYLCDTSPTVRGARICKHSGDTILLLVAYQPYLGADAGVNKLSID